LSAKNLFSQKVNLDEDSNHYYLNSQKDIQRFSEDRKVDYLKPKKSTFIEFQNKLKLAPCNLLETAHNQQSLGVYTTKPIWVEPNKIRVIGHYVGNLLEDGEENPDSSFVFELPNGQIIDASEKCNFTAVINGAMSLQMSNIKIQTCETPSGDNFVEYYLHGGTKGLFIQSGSQLLGFYGSTDKYDDYQFGKKFLTPRDLPLTSSELYTRYCRYDAYCDEPATLDKEFLKLFNIKANTLFAAPKESRLTNFFDIQFLAYKTKTRAFTASNLLHQNLQENITPLMLACWEGDLDKIRRFLSNGANPNIPSSNYGYTAFHIAVLSRLGVAQKIQIINLLAQERCAVIHKSLIDEPIRDIIKPNLTKISDKLYWFSQIDLTAQDKYERTIAHIAVAQNNAALLHFLLEKHAGFWNYQDCDGYDILEMAIIAGDINVVNCLLTNLRGLKETDILMHQEIVAYQLGKNNYDKSPRLFLALEIFYNRKQDSFDNIQAIYNIIRENFNDILSPSQKRSMDATHRRVMHKNPAYISSGLFKPKPHSIHITDGSTMGITK
jgi:hypothetical protein